MKKLQKTEAKIMEKNKRLLELCIARKRKVLPDALNLIEMELAVFGGLSWKSEFCRMGSPAAHKARLKDFHSLCKRACDLHAVKYRSVLFFFRDEPSRAGEWHGHFIIAAKGIETVSAAELSATLQNVWTKEFNKGIAKIEPFEASRQLEGVCYVCKVSRNDRGNEFANFPVLSTALLNLIQEKRAAMEVKPLQEQSLID